MGLIGALAAGCASNDAASQSFAPEANTFRAPSPSASAAAQPVGQTISGPGEWRKTRSTYKVTTPIKAPSEPRAPVAVAPKPAPAPVATPTPAPTFTPPAAPQPTTVPVASQTPSSGTPSYEALSKMPVVTGPKASGNQIVPKSYAEFKGPLPKPDLGKLDALTAEDKRLGDELHRLGEQRRAALKAGRSDDSIRSAMKRTMEQRRSAIQLLVALQVYQSDPSRSNNIGYAKALKRYQSAR